MNSYWILMIDFETNCDESYRNASINRIGNFSIDIIVIQ